MLHGSLDVRWYRPDPAEDHLPHDRDELYFIVSGRARFRRGNEAGAFDEEKYGVFGQNLVDVAPGDVLFVPAGAVHRFEQATPDFAVWAVFYGPEGGETP